MEYVDPLPILQLGNLEVDFRRYSYIHADFSSYFPPYACHDWEYSWRVEKDGEVFTETGKRCCAPLSVVVQRLNLLGWNESVGRRIYEDHRTASQDRHPYFRRLHLPPYPRYDVLAEGVASIDIGQVEQGHPTRRENSPWHYAALRAVEIDGGGIPTEHEPDPVKWYRNKIENLDTSTILHMLAQNTANLDLPVTWWAYNEVIEGELSEDDYADGIGAKAQDRVMLVTEGKSDTSVLKKALSTFRPHIEDFFTFIDMSDNYPFTGVGNLSNFYKGLLKLEILNNVIVIFDNDAEGAAKFDDASKLNTLSNIRPMKLPSLPTLSQFLTVGPTGEHYADINGRASSIECFLDLNWSSKREPAVRWTSYFRFTDEYQGELVDKGEYVKHFLALRDTERSAYDSSMVDVLLDHISAETEDMAMERLMRDY